MVVCRSTSAQTHFSYSQPTIAQREESCYVSITKQKTGIDAGLHNDL